MSADRDYWTELKYDIDCICLPPVSSGLVRACPGLSRLVRAYLGSSGLVQARPGSSGPGLALEQALPPKDYQFSESASPFPLLLPP